MDITKIGERIKERRRALNMTQKDLADAMHISDSLISKWETGESLPSLEYFAPLSEALKISESQLMGIESEKSADGEKAEQKPDTKKKIKAFWNKHRKPLLISIIGAASALFILAVSLLSAFVFAPLADKNTYLANKEKYLAAIDNGIDRYLELGYFNIRMTTEVDGDEDKNPSILQGYVDENGKAVYYNSETREIVKDGVKTFTNKSGQRGYEQPESIKTTSDLLEALLESWGDDDDLLDIEEYVIYMRKESYGYYIEFSEKYLLDDLKPSEAKNIKFNEKIKGKAVMDGNKLKSVTMTVKFRNTKENENFTIVNKIEFLQQKPIIEHKSYVKTVSTKFVSGEGFLELLGAKSVKETTRTNTQSALIDQSIRYSDGYLFSLESSDNSVTFYDLDTLRIKDKIVFPYGTIKAVTVYGDAIWFATDAALYRNDMPSKTTTKKLDFSYGTPYFNGKYFWCNDKSGESTFAFVYDIEKDETVATLYTAVEYVDLDGMIYYQNGLELSLRIYGSNKTISGRIVFKEEDGYIYTYNYPTDNEVYIYKSGEYQGMVNFPIYFPRSDMIIAKGYCYNVGSSALYNYGGKVAVTFPQVALNSNGSYGYSIYDVKILGIWEDVLLVNLIRKSGDSLSTHNLIGFYRIGEWDAPVACAAFDKQIDTVKAVSYGDVGFCVAGYYENRTSGQYTAYSEYWVRTRK